MIVWDIARRGGDGGRGGNELWGGTPKPELGELGGERLVDEGLDVRAANLDRRQREQQVSWLENYNILGSD